MSPLSVRDNSVLREPHHGLVASSVRETAVTDAQNGSLGRPPCLTEQSQPEGLRVAMSHTFSGAPPPNRPLTSLSMQFLPPRNPAYDAAQIPGYPAAVSSSFPFGTLHDRNFDMQYPRQHVNTEPYSHPPDISSSVLNHNVHANLPTIEQIADPPQSTQSNPNQCPNVLYPVPNLPHQFPQTLDSGGFASTGPFRYVNCPPYPPPQGYFPYPLAFTPYSAPPYHQPQTPADRRASWSTPYHANQQFDVTAGYSNSQVPYSMYPQRNPTPASVPSPVKNPLDSTISSYLPSPAEQRLDTGPTQGGKESLVRRSYHPNPPAYHLQWVMWVGNIPAYATYDELWRFFTSFSEGTRDAPAQGGVLSIFPISRTNCAFVNYQAEADLIAAIKHFNGHPLRPGDPRCPKLVCRIRRTDDDLKAGVGGQRGMGMHAHWIKEHAARVLKGQVTSSLEASMDVLPKISISNHDDFNVSTSRTISSSTSSTTSSLLARFYPQRYFILKSLSQFDLDVSKEEGLWATQKHNEGILNQAFRTSKDVFLIFSVNKSGEFYGYAKMTGSSRSLSRKERKLAFDAPAEDSQHHHFLSPSPNRLVDESPLPMDTNTAVNGAGHTILSPAIENVVSAPAQLETDQEQMTTRSSSARHSLDHRLVFPSIFHMSQRFELDPLAPVRAIRSKPGDSQVSAVEVGASSDGNKYRGRAEGNGGGEESEKSVWGGSFKIQWLSTEKISFQKTKHLRNPWNHDREVKVSRDGTELEPDVGHRLIEQWAVLAKGR